MSKPTLGKRKCRSFFSNFNFFVFFKNKDDTTKNIYIFWSLTQSTHSVFAWVEKKRHNCTCIVGLIVLVYFTNVAIFFILYVWIKFEIFYLTVVPLLKVKDFPKSIFVTHELKISHYKYSRFLLQFNGLYSHTHTPIHTLMPEHTHIYYTHKHTQYYYY